jgi:hypothetical protein
MRLAMEARAIALALCSPVSLLVLRSEPAAQVQWRVTVSPFRVVGSIGARDTGRGRTVLVVPNFHGGERVATSEWDGRSFFHHEPEGAWPSVRHGAEIVFDAARGRTVLFGGERGYSGQYLNETWEWDGARWTLRTPLVSPPARKAHAMSWDPARQRIVLFGGDDSNFVREPLRDTWEWDGDNWTRMAPPVSPPALRNHTMAYDPTGQRTLLFGGWTSANDTWAWDGTTWTQLTPATSPSARADAPAATDARRGRIVLYGGFNGVTHTQDTWEWTGSDWVQVLTAAKPPGSFLSNLTFDEARGHVTTITFDYQSNQASAVAVWEYDGADWRKPLRYPIAPERAYTAVAFDEARGETVLFGGFAGSRLADTWQWDGTQWHDRPAGPAPAPRHSHAMAYDSARHEVLLFGGGGDSGLLQDLWAWNGSAWSARTGGVPPLPRMFHAMAFDRARSRLVVFGGTNGSQALGDTWEWDGTTWSRATPAASPPARHAHAMCFDETRGLVVLFGGFGPGPFSDTWEYDGLTWRRRTPATNPPAGTLGMAYDSARRRSVLVVSDSASSATWEWDGTAWTRRDAPSGPWPLPTALAFDTRRDVIVDTAGSSVWEYGPIDPASFSTFGTGCAGSSGIPRLAPASRGDLPWIGETMRLEVASIPSGALAIVMHGFSRTTWLGVPLPLDLGTLGMPGCALRISPDLFFPCATTGSRATADLFFPNDRSHLAIPVFDQALVLDMLANPFGVTFTNAGEGRIGAK